MQHLFLPQISLGKGFLHPAFNQYLKEWREEAIQRADAGDVAASVCLQATLIDLVLYGKPRHAWGEIMEEFLMDGDKPLAYSEAFGKRLYKFNQYRQSTVHAIHTRWWIERLNNPDSIDHERYAAQVLAKRQGDGLIYDKDVSETMLRHRMKVELTLTMAMGAEILESAGKLSGTLPIELATSISDSKKCPTLGYMSMEFFRLRALRTLGHENLFPAGISKYIEDCAENLEVGWCDFAMKSKVDAYMGTAKRTQRDKPIHSPLIACHVAELSETVPDMGKKEEIKARLSVYARHLDNDPLDIPAFQMRDVPIPFGVDKTPIETICASYLIARCQDVGGAR